MASREAFWAGSVRHVLGGGRRVQTPECNALQAHYGFEAVFANPARNNEKGGVENLVQCARRAHRTTEG